MPMMKKLFNNTGKPQGFLGKMMVAGMNRGHAAVTEWGLNCLPEEEYISVADLGCGGGKAISRLLKMFPDAHVTGLDYSPVSVAAAKKENQKAMEEGRCEFFEGDVSDLPFEDQKFDLITAFETIYFWPGPVASFQEVYRVLKPGGCFAVVCESDGENPDDEKWLNIVDGMQLFHKEELKAMLRQAGFPSVEIFHNLTKHYLCLIARK